MGRDTQGRGLHLADDDDRPPHLRQRFRDFAESEHLRLLQASYLIGAALFFAALLGEHFAFGQRLGFEDVAAACAFVVAQMAFLGWRVAARLPSLRPEGRAAIIVANGWMWVLLSVIHTNAADTAPYMYEFVLIQIVFCYFFAGLAQYYAILGGLLIGLSLPLLQLLVGDAGSEAMARGVFVLLAVNAVGSAGRWWIEQNQRSQFATHLLLRSQAMTDPLTGLANRRGLHRGLEGAMHIAQREGKHLAIALLDLDGFKPINDRFGHAAGDDVLREVAARLRVVARRSTDTVARLGGDEFAVIWAARTIPDLYALADRLHETTREISMRFAEGDPGLARTSASLGVLVIRKPDPAQDLGRLLDRADRLSMMVKRIGGRAMILRESEEPRRVRMKSRAQDAVPPPRFRLGPSGFGERPADF